MAGYPWVDSNVLTGSELDAPFWRNRMRDPQVKVGSSALGFAFYNGSNFMVDGVVSPTNLGSFNLGSTIELPVGTRYLRFDLGSHYKTGYLQMWGLTHFNNQDGGSMILLAGSLTTSMTVVDGVGDDGNSTNALVTWDIPYYDISQITGGVRYLQFDGYNGANAGDDCVVGARIKELVVMGGYA